MELSLARVMKKKKHRLLKKGEVIHHDDEWWNGSKWIKVSTKWIKVSTKWINEDGVEDGVDSGDVGWIYDPEDWTCKDGSVIKWRRKIK